MLNGGDMNLLDAHFPAWRHLSEKERRLITNSASLLNLKKNDIVRSAKEGCCGVLIIKKGTVRSYTLSEQGKEITFYRLAEGDISVLSASCVIKDITFDIYIEALSDCEIVQILPCAFVRAMRSNIYLEAAVYKLAAQRLCIINWAMQQIMFTSFDKRLASFLLSESKRLRSERIDMTHEQVAKLMGTAREVVSRMLKYFSNEKYVRLSRGKIEILDKKALERL